MEAVPKLDPTNPKIQYIQLHELPFYRGRKRWLPMRPQGSGKLWNNPSSGGMISRTCAKHRWSSRSFFNCLGKQWLNLSHFWRPSSSQSCWVMIGSRSKWPIMPSAMRFFSSEILAERDVLTFHAQEKDSYKKLTCQRSDMKHPGSLNDKSWKIAACC